MPTSLRIFTSKLHYFRRYGGGAIRKSGGCWSPQTPPSGKYLHPDIVPANVYHCMKFQLPSSISFGDMEGVAR